MTNSLRDSGNNSKLNEAVKLLNEMQGNSDTLVIKDVLKVTNLLAEAMSELPWWVWDNSCCPPGESCCCCD